MVAPFLIQEKRAGILPFSDLCVIVFSQRAGRAKTR
jgi:hypothetical protein